MTTLLGAQSELNRLIEAAEHVLGSLNTELGYEDRLILERAVDRARFAADPAAAYRPLQGSSSN